MYAINLIFGIAPMILLFYHITGIFTRNTDKILMASKILLNLAFSTILKEIFRINRRIKNEKIQSENLVFLVLKNLLSKISSKYAFPSSHAAYFSFHFFSNPTWFNFIFCLVGSISRVFYCHHTKIEVISGLLAGYIFNKILNVFLTQKKIKKI